MKEYVQHKVNGLLFEHRNRDDLTTQMLFALESPEFIKKLGERGYLYSKNGDVVPIQNHCEDLLKIYNSARDFSVLS